MINLEKSHIVFFTFIFFIFLIIVMLIRHMSLIDAKNSQLIKKNDEINITVEQVNFNRGVAVFNDNYYIIAGKLQNSGKIIDVVNLKDPYILTKKENNDTIFFSNKDTTLIVILK